jgi:hypothetical protein
MFKTTRSMKLDIHITTCHRYNVKCRARPHESPNWNVKEWTHEERINITKLSVYSIINFASRLRNYGHVVSLTLLDDGSDIPESIDILNELPITMKKFPNRGSSAGINDHYNSLRADPPDYVLHIEDDNILFNPKNIDWLTSIDTIKQKNNDIKVFTFRSGLPVDPKDKGYKGAWGPVGFTASPIPCILFNKMGNAHHVMSWKDYSNFFPLNGNTGSCEEYMNSKLHGFNAEPQIPIHCFHSHMWSYPITTNNLNMWHKTGEGFEFGIKDMYEYLLDKNQVYQTLFDSDNLPKTELLTNYDF